MLVGSSLSALTLVVTILLQPADGAPRAAQPEPAPPPADAAPAPIPPQVRLGRRVELVRQNMAVCSTLVIVPDAASYVAAISRWTLSTPPVVPAPPANPNDPIAPEPPKRYIGSYFPVLIDDGSFRAHEDIARFVRAFLPARVVTWKQGDTNPPTREEIDAALLKSWNARPSSADPGADPVAPSADSTSASLRARWTPLGIASPGIVCASESDPAWTAALALAAARAQYLAWITPPRLGPAADPGARPPTEPDERYSLAQCDEFSTLIEAACSVTGASWDALADDIDSVTLCMGTPAAVQLPRSDNRDMLATTDLVGRARTEPRVRWAWCGQIFGSESRAAYMAMCAIFLQPRSAWLFDGYDNSGPFAAFDSTAAGELLSAAGVACTVNDAPDQSADSWRRRIAGAPELLRDLPVSDPAGIEAGLIAVNTSGYADFFDLRPGQCKSTDVPLLRIPSIVHFVHSWSANQVNVRSTIAGRFIDSGAYVYIGSVHEPYLSAFVATPLLVQRMLATAPVGVSARLDDGAPWKVAYVGDPLVTLGPEAPRANVQPGLPGVVDTAGLLAQALRDNDADRAVSLLTLLGRDADAARLVFACIAQEHPPISALTARRGALAVFRSAWPPAMKPGEPAPPPRHEVIAQLVDRAGESVSQSPEVLDALWQSAYLFMGSLSPGVIETMKSHLRPEQQARDAIELATAIRKVQSADAARDFLRSVRSKMTHEPWKKELEREIAR
ncbi:MAG: hypothetical protein AB7G11_02130 [Phycisphaerales bacterium]